MSRGNSIPQELVQEGVRVMRLCNACRYCEGFCAVFPAMERRLAFSEQDLNYLSNLCHNCSECYYACPFVPPHEFRLNFPKALAEIRDATYRKYAWPGFLAGFFRQNILALTLSVTGCIALFLFLMLSLGNPSLLSSPSSAALVSFSMTWLHKVIVLMFGAVVLFVPVVLVIDLIGFWRDMGETVAAALNPVAIGQAIWHVLRLRYLKGGGDGCAYPEDVPSHARRWFHHVTFYGLLMALVANVYRTGPVFHNYSFLSFTFILSSVGGLGLLIGPLGLLWLKGVRNPELTNRKQTGMDVGFLALLFLTGLTGFLVLAFRETPVMVVVLAVHLGLVLSLFVTLPYSKFVHAIYRFAALIRNAIEERRVSDRPNPG